jgi:O-antigen/teichoic acid export membrane protein
LILAFARITNFALVFISPILLVRILEPETFGQYREFIAYSMIVTSLAGFSITTNLLYFIPRHPENTRAYVSHTNWLTFGMSVLACFVLWAFGSQIRSNTSFDFMLPLLAYALLFVNVTFLESYWVATKQPKYVFYYSTVRTIVRLTAVIGTAYQTRSVVAILNALIITELLRVVASLLITRRLQVLSFAVDGRLLRQQLGFIMPLGFATSLHHLHQYVGQIVISAQLGVVALAVYAVASFKVPVIRIARSAVGDAIFPDMVRQAASEQRDKLRLWKRGNIAYSFLILPLFVILFWYADVFIPLLFTDKYAEAVPIFRILSLIMPIEAIELSSPLRAANRTRELLAGNVLLFASNLVCILIFFRYFEEFAIYGPAVGLVAGSLVQHIYMGWRVTRLYNVRVVDLLKWPSQAAIYCCTGISSLMLFAGEFVSMPELFRLLAFSLAFASTYFLLIRLFKLEEVETFVEALSRKARARLDKSH